MIAYAPSEYRLIAAVLEEGIPLVREPFSEISSRLGIRESLVLDAAREMLKSGFMRKFGAFFDFRLLGYKGYLFGVETKKPDDSGLIARICDRVSVTHAYGRRHRFDFWFTVLTGYGGDADEIRDFLVSWARGFVALETIAAIKLRPSFAGAAVSESRPLGYSETGVCAPDGFTLKLVGALQKWIALRRRPFDSPARALGMAAEDFLNWIRPLAVRGILRRVGASFDHRGAGLTSNSLCAVDMSGMPEHDAIRIAADVSRWSWASHCYLRKLYRGDTGGAWPYNLYIMIHAESDELLFKRENVLREELREFSFVSMRTTEEYKKTSFKI